MNRRPLVAVAIVGVLIFSGLIILLAFGILDNAKPSKAPTPVVIVSPSPLVPPTGATPLVVTVPTLVPGKPTLVPGPPTLVPGPSTVFVSPVPGSTRTVTVTPSPTRTMSSPTPSPTCLLGRVLGC